jgi:predicted proteasome-type protease
MKLSEKLYLDLLEKNTENHNITLVWKPIKRNNQYFSKIIIKWKHLRDFLEPFRKTILTNSDISIIFED